VSTLTAIEQRVRVAVNDLVSEIDAFVLEDIRRAQKRIEDYWDRWPFLDAVLQVSTLQYQYAQFMDGSNVPQAVRDRWLRWRTDVPPWYVYGGALQRRPVEMQWSVGPHTSDAVTSGPAYPGDLREVLVKASPIAEQSGPPLRISIVEDADATGSASYGHAPSVFYIDPPTDLGDPAAPGVYQLNLPIQLRQPTLTASVVESNYWTVNLPEALEDSAIASFLMTNQDQRYLAYEERANARLTQHRREWKRRLFRQTDSTLVPRTGVYGTRNSRSL